MFLCTCAPVLARALARATDTILSFYCCEPHHSWPSVFHSSTTQDDMSDPVPQTPDQIAEAQAEMRASAVLEGVGSPPPALKKSLSGDGAPAGLSATRLSTMDPNAPPFAPRAPGAGAAAEEPIDALPRPPQPPVSAPASTSPSDAGPRTAAALAALIADLEAQKLDAVSREDYLVANDLKIRVQDVKSRLAQLQGLESPGGSSLFPSAAADY